jgi:hypothetical protein
MRIGEIEADVPLRLKSVPNGVLKSGYTGSKRQTYTKIYDALSLGQSFVFEGDRAEQKAFRSALRNRNQRYRERDGEVHAPQFDWDYEGEGALRIWRVQ